MATAVSTELQSLLDKAARLQKRLNFRKAATRTLENRLDGYRATIAQLVPASAQDLSEFASATKGGGVSFNLAAAGGANVRVTVPAAKLLGKIAGELVAKLKALCGKKFGALFVTHYTCAANFRQLAHEQLADKATALEVIALCEEPSKPTVTIS